MKSDALLLRESQRDAGAFREVYDRYAGRIHAFHLNRTRDPEAALDLTAETFAQAWAARARFRDEAGGSAGPWLFAIARHLLLASVRARQRERSACDLLGLPTSSASEPDESWLEGIDDAIAELPPGQQEAIRLRVVDDLAYIAVGRSLGISERAARVRVYRGLTAIRHHLRSKEATR